MKIKISSPEGNIFAALGIATAFMRDSGRTIEDIQKLRASVFNAGDYKTACEAITAATFGSITFEE